MVDCDHTLQKELANPGVDHRPLGARFGLALTTSRLYW